MEVINTWPVAVINSKEELSTVGVMASILATAAITSTAYGRPMTDEEIQQNVEEFAEALTQCFLQCREDPDGFDQD